MSTQHFLDRVTEQLGHVRADLADLELGLLDHHEHTAGLDAARDVDRLPGAVVEIDGRADGKQSIDGAVGVLTRDGDTPRL
ncbi:hypothetical protein GCM10010409_33810 [Mycolicibacterium diernhoferi]